MRQKPIPACWPIVTVLVAATVLAGCTTSLNEVSGASSSSSPPAPVEVQRGDIRSVVVLNGTVVPKPTYAIASPEAGDFQATVDINQPVRKGQQVAVVGGRSIAAPADGSIATGTTRERQRVGIGVPLLNVQYPGLGISVAVNAADVYRLYTVPATGKAQIDSGPAGVDCEAIVGQPVEAAGQPPGDTAGSIKFACLLPLTTATVPGLSARVGIETGKATGVALLPVQAVLGVSQTGRVNKVVDGSVIPTTVGLGISDGTMIEITSGLQPGDRVLSYSPLISD